MTLTITQGPFPNHLIITSSYPDTGGKGQPSNGTFLDSLPLGRHVFPVTESQSYKPQAIHAHLILYKRLLLVGISRFSVAITSLESKRHVSTTANGRLGQTEEKDGFPFQIKALSCSYPVPTHPLAIVYKTR